MSLLILDCFRTASTNDSCNFKCVYCEWVVTACYLSCCNWLTFVSRCIHVRIHTDKYTCGVISILIINRKMYWI